MHKKKLLFAGLVVCGMGIYSSAQANERRFGYTYESGVLPPGVKEIEPWMTWRTGRSSFYSAFDYRMEYEMGLIDRLQTSLYLNWHSESQEDPSNPGQKINSQGFDGVSSEWKYKLLDPVADPLGLAFYQEYTFQSDELGWESKLILDKKVGNTLIAYNAVVEPVWEFGPGSDPYTLNLENNLGVTYLFTPAFSGGMEVFNQNEKTRTSPGLVHSAIFVGPVIGYAHDNWWMTLTVLRQLPAIKRSIDNPQDAMVLDSLEKFNVRILGSIRI